MKPEEREKERRPQQACERLGAASPACVICSEDDPHCLEQHHIAGRHCGDTVVPVCRNCHRKLSNAQKDHPKSVSDPTLLERIGRFLLGLGDLFDLLTDRLHELGRLLISLAHREADLAGV